MGGYTELVKFLKEQSEESRIKEFLKAKGYDNSLNDDFTLNLWTNRLITRPRHTQDEPQETVIEEPDHLVSFLSIPANLQADCIDTNSDEFREWISSYQWQNIPGVNYPFSQRKIQACSEGLLLPEWKETSTEGWLKSFLLVRRDAICEYGIGGKTYYSYNDDVIFQLIQIVGLFWQFLIFLKDLNQKFLIDKNSENLIIVNIRGTKNALMGNLAANWNEPTIRSFNAYRPRCFDKHLQFQRTVGFSSSAHDIEDIVHWFATRIDNAWGQFTPRCYVHPNVDRITTICSIKISVSVR